MRSSGGIFLTALLLMLATTACSNQWRESEPGVIGEDALALMDEIWTNDQSKSNMFAGIEDLRSDNYSTVYFSESNPSMGEVGSIFSIADAGFLTALNGQPTAGLNVFDLNLNYVGIIFMDAVVAGGQRVFTLLIKFGAEWFSNGPQYFVAQSEPGAYSMSDHDFVTTMYKNGVEIVLRSNDIGEIEGQLAPTIQLKVFVVQNGEEHEVGQFSVLHGFGGIE